MGHKLEKGSFPSGHGRDDFKCFGPPATQDAQFEGTCICDMGCFTQDGKDSNKYYHAAVVQSKKTQAFYVYFEWGRTGASAPSYQFVECSSKADADDEYCSQLHAKNDKRGMWTTLAGKKVLQAKPGKDCYLVRPQATRSTGLPDARTIAHNEGAKPSNGTTVTETKKDMVKPKAKKSTADPQTIALMRDLNVATVSYARTSMADSAIPTQSAIDEARDILIEAQKRVVKVGDDTDQQLKDKILVALSNHMYSRIPKRKPVGGHASDWILSANNIFAWQQDLDAFESALATQSVTVENETDPFEGMPLVMSWIDPKSELGKFLYDWAPKASRNVHGNMGGMKISNLWEVARNGEMDRMRKMQETLAAGRYTYDERPLHQPSKRPDVVQADVPLWVKSHTCLAFHGSRSVNISGILREGFRMPKELVGVSINGAAFGPGHYTADDWRKSAQYCSMSQCMYTRGSGGVSRRDAFMFICDVAYGKMHVVSGSGGYTSVPAGRHTLFAKMGQSGVYNNEFITFNKSQTAIRYLIEFKA